MAIYKTRNSKIGNVIIPFDRETKKEVVVVVVVAVIVDLSV
jgi:hypothetical protein